MKVSSAREEDLKEPIGIHMSEKGFEVYFEVPFKGKKPDVVCVDPRGDTVITLELKLRRWKRALHQASVCRLWSNKTYAVFPEEAMKLIERNKTAFRREGVGVILVEPLAQRINEFVEPEDSSRCSSLWKSSIVDAARTRGIHFSIEEGI